MIFGDIVLIITGESNKLQKIHNHLEKAENVFFLHMVVDFLIWFAHGDKKKLPKITDIDVKLKENQNCQFLAVLFLLPRAN